MSQASESTQSFQNHAPTLVQPRFIRQLRHFSLGLLLASLILFIGGMYTSHQSENIRNSQLSQIHVAEIRIQQELILLNSPTAIESIKPQGLKTLLSLGQQVSQNHSTSHWFGPFHNQTLQVLLTQAIESLARPVAGVNSNSDKQRQLEIQLRLDTLPKLDQLKTHILQANNGYMVLFLGLSTLLAIIGIILGIHWNTLRKTLALNRRVHLLSRALNNQQESDLKREGAQSALQGLLKVLNQNQQLEHQGTLVQLGQQLQDLQQSGQTVLQFAKSFHLLSTHGTLVTKSVLNSEHRNIKADHHMDIMQKQLEGLRSDIRNVAQGLRKAGEVSRQLLRHLDPSQMELTLTETENNQHLQQLVEQSQQALKESIEGLVMASQKINSGQYESNKLAEYMAVNQTAWSNLLSQVEQVAESASNESKNALYLAKRLIDKNDQVTKAPPQLLP
jgi:hypothetical protein